MKSWIMLPIVLNLQVSGVHESFRIFLHYWCYFAIIKLWLAMNLPTLQLMLHKGKQLL